MTLPALETPHLAAATDPTLPLLLRRLDDRLTVAEAGGKAATLGRIAAHGIAVPDAVVLTTAAFARWLDSNGLRSALEALVSDVDAADPQRLAAVGHAIRAHAAEAPMPREVEDALDAAFDALTGQVPLVVRSSAVGEDSRDASFAGQLDSVLHVRTRADLRRAVRQCWTSAWSDRALFYRRARRAPLDRVAVLIQRQIAPSIAGVLFTADPCDPAWIAGEYCRGLADGLVSGAIDPDRFRAPRADAVRGDVPDVPPPIARAGLVPVALRLERLLGAPQDIEWAIDTRGMLWIVQARPITTVGPKSTALQAPVWWSNANVNENFPTPISPLLYSIASTGYYHYFRNLGLAFGVSRRRLAAMDHALRGIIGVHGARMYYNLTNIHAVLRMAPFGDALAQAFNRFTGVGETAPSPPGAVGWKDGRAAQSLEALRIAAWVAWQYLFFRRRIEAFERQADAFAADTRPYTLAGAPLVDLAAMLRRFIDIRQHRWKDASLADAAAMVGYALLERTTRRIAPAGSETSLHNRLLRALPGVPSSQPPVRLWALSRLIRRDPALALLFQACGAEATLHSIRTEERFSAFREAFDRYLEDWGFRSSAELMLTVPTLQEDPTPLIALLARHAAEGDDRESPASAMARQAAARVAETRRVLRQLALRAPHRAVALWAALAATRRAIGYRERARLKQALLYTRCRAIAREIGTRLASRGRLAAADDVFLLRWEEIDDVVSGRAMFPDGLRELVRLRAADHARQSAWTPPDAFVLERGECWHPGVGPAPRDATAAADDSQVLRGTSACGGRATGRAAVLASVDEAARLQPGDVLVTRQTDPGWAPVFGLIAGLVIERGGMLSHGAVVAREFGLPCVVGVREATRRIAHGRAITVDGDAGLCILHEPAAEVRT